LSPQISKAAFLPISDDTTKRFKYKFKLRGIKYSSERLIALKNACKKISGRVQLKLGIFDFKAASILVSVWLINAFLEGIIVNFAVWGLLGWEFNLITVMAWGFAIKQSLDIYWRLKINGTTTKLPEKNK
jgi:hypothetical protein